VPTGMNRGNHSKKQWRNRVPRAHEDEPTLKNALLSVHTCSPGIVNLTTALPIMR